MWPVMDTCPLYPFLCELITQVRTTHPWMPSPHLCTIQHRKQTKLLIRPNDKFRYNYGLVMTQCSLCSAAVQPSRVPSSTTTTTAVQEPMQSEGQLVGWLMSAPAQHNPVQCVLPCMTGGAVMCVYCGACQKWQQCRLQHGECQMMIRQHTGHLTTRLV